MKSRHLSLLILSTLFVFSCSEHTDGPDVSGEPAGDGILKSIASVITERENTRATATSWEDGDLIGLFVSGDGSQANMQYTASGGGAFTPVDSENAVRLPVTGEAVKLTAYYPYHTSADNGEYPVELADQSDAEVDILFSDNLTSVTAGQAQPTMLFSRPLSRIRVHIAAGQGLVTVAGAQLVINGIVTGGILDLRTGALSGDGSRGTVRMNTTVAGSTATAVAAVIPQVLSSDITVTIKLAGGYEYTMTIGAGTAFLPNTTHTYSVTLHTENTSPSLPNYGWWETPAVADLPNTVYVTRDLPDRQGRNYSYLYNTEYKFAYWVAYPYVPEYTGTYRSNSWSYDPLVDNQYQVRINSKSFTNSSNDRGHQIPNSDRSYSMAASKSTFYSTNATPQNNNLNTGLWNVLEQDIRDWALNCDTMYVVTGAMIVTDDDQVIDYDTDNDGQPVAVPKYYFKALAQLLPDGTYQTAAFRMFNRSYPSGSKPSAYRMSVSELEQITGFTFFPHLPESTKQTVTSSYWQ